MEVLKVAEEIHKKINELEMAKKHIATRSEAKALSTATYDKALALIIMKLRNGGEVELEGEKIIDPPATVLEKIAKGIVWKEKLAMEKAEAEYKSLLTYMSVSESQLNGFQSIFRHLDEN